MKKSLGVVVLLILLVGAGAYYWVYGFSYPPCNQHEKEVPIPQRFNNVTIRFTQPILIHDTRGLHCSPISKQYQSLVLKEYVDTLGDNRNTKPMEFNGEFTVIKAFTYEKKGRYPLPPYVHLLLRNSKNEYYVISDDKFENLVSGGLYVELLENGGKTRP